MTHNHLPASLTAANKLSDVRPRYKLLWLRFKVRLFLREKQYNTINININNKVGGGHVSIVSVCCFDQLLNLECGGQKSEDKVTQKSKSMFMSRTPEVQLVQSCS